MRKETERRWEENRNETRRQEGDKEAGRIQE